MYLKVIELTPGFSSLTRKVRDGDYSNVVVEPGSAPKNYTIIVGTRNKPTNRQREKIQEAISGAWRELFDPQDWEQQFGRKMIPPKFGVSVIGPDSTTISGETTIPYLLFNGFYIVFALLESDLTVPEEEEREIQEEILRGIESQLDGMKIKPRVAVVTLYNCSVQLIEGHGDYPEERESPESRILRRSRR